MGFFFREREKIVKIIKRMKIMKIIKMMETIKMMNQVVIGRPWIVFGKEEEVGFCEV